MEFIYADELKKKFDICGHFYNLKVSNSILKCRSNIEIKQKDKLIQTPGIIVIMMNPGSSIYLDKNYEPKTFSKNEYNNIKTKEIIPTRPDNTQYQIMRLMEFNKWNFVRKPNIMTHL